MKKIWSINNLEVMMKGNFCFSGMGSLGFLFCGDAVSVNGTDYQGALVHRPHPRFFILEKGGNWYGRQS